MFKTIFRSPKLKTHATAELTPTTELKKIRVNVHNGDIKIRQWEQNHLQAHIKVTARGVYAEEYAGRSTDECWTFAQRGDEVVFEQNRTMNVKNLLVTGSLNVDVELYVPRQPETSMEAWLATHNGSISVERYQGDIRALTHNGAVQVQELIGQVRMESHNGDLRVEQLDGDLHAETHNGRIEIECVRGAVEAETHNGKIRAEECGKKVSLKTSNGFIQVINSEAPTGAWDISTANGGIDVEIPRGSQAAFDIQSKTGGIRGDVLPMEMSGVNNKLSFSLGSGEIAIRLESKAGKINVNYSR